MKINMTIFVYMSNINFECWHHVNKIIRLLENRQFLVSSVANK